MPVDGCRSKSLTTKGFGSVPTRSMSKSTTGEVNLNCETITSLWANKILWTCKWCSTSRTVSCGDLSVGSSFLFDCNFPFFPHWCTNSLFCIPTVLPTPQGYCLTCEHVQTSYVFTIILTQVVNYLSTSYINYNL